MLKVGCAGFPVGHDRYWRTFSFLEARTGEAMPRPATLADWKASSPAGAEFSVQAYRLVTHGPHDAGFPPAGKRLSPSRQLQCGAFRDSLEVSEAWMSTKAAAETLGARIIVFETPPSFQPGPDRLRDMYRFFKAIPRGRLSFVWRPRGSAWDRRMVDRVCADLGLVELVDPLKGLPPQRGAFRYWRPLGPRTGSMPVDNLSTIRREDPGVPTYLVFSHREAFHDAERFLAEPSGPGRRR